MAKTLHQSPPSSAVARLLDQDAARKAIAPPAADPQPAASRAVTNSNLTPTAFITTESTGEPARIKREFVLSASAEATFNQLVDLYRRSTRTRLSGSHVIRAILRGLAHCMDSLEHESHRRLVPQKLPSNARGREAERARFEEQIAWAFIAGVRAAPMDEEFS